MKKKLYVTILLSCLLALSLIGCNKNDNSDKEIKTTTEEQVYEATVRAADTNTIATMIDNLYQSDNVTISPLSLDMALGMAANGATDEVKEKIATYLNMSIDDFNNFAQEYQLNKTPGIQIANSLWVKDDNKINEDTSNLLFDMYDADIFNHTFDKTLITDANMWCSKKTNNLIPTMLDSVPDCDSFLFSALYFNSNWQSVFSEDDIKSETFNSFNDSVSVDMMRSIEHYYYENDKVTAFGKDYINTRYQFIGILPKDEGEFNLADLDLDTLLESESETEVNIALPKFDIEYTAELNDSLKNIGLDCIFNDNAFDTILENKSMCINSVIQKNKIIVNETGTEAASVTEMDIKTTSSLNNMTDVKTVELNRPFVYMIYDTETETPLFIGKIVNPTK